MSTLRVAPGVVHHTVACLMQIPTSGLWGLGLGLDLAMVLGVNMNDYKQWGER